MYLLTLLYNSNRFGLPLLEVKLMTLPIYYFLLLMNVDPVSSVEKPGINNYSSNGEK